MSRTRLALPADPARPSELASLEEYSVAPSSVAAHRTPVEQMPTSKVVLPTSLAPVSWCLVVGFKFVGIADAAPPQRGGATGVLL